MHDMHVSMLHLQYDILFSKITNVLWSVTNLVYIQFNMDQWTPFAELHDALYVKGLDFRDV